MVGDRDREAPAGDAGVMMLAVGEYGGLRSPLAGGSGVEGVGPAGWPGWLLLAG